MVYVLMDLTAGNAAGNRGCAYYTGTSEVPRSLVLLFVTDAYMFWDFGSLFSRRCGVTLASCCGSGIRVLSRRCGVSCASCCGSGNISSFYLFWTPAYFLISDDSPSTRFPDVAPRNIYRMSRHPHGPSATQPSDDSPSTDLSDVPPCTHL